MMHTASFMALAALIASSNALSIPTVPKVARANAVVTYGQCGGNGYTGSTECASGSACVKASEWYSQCLPGAVASTPAAAKPTTAKASSTSTKAAAATSTKAAAATTSAKAAATTSSAATPATSPSTSSSFLAGLNLAGFDFSVYTDGSFSGTGQDPPTSQITHFAKQGVNLFRVPFAWQLATPTLGGTLSSSFLTRYDTVVKAALASSSNAHVILDLHNYARWNGAVVGQGGPTNDQFANLWSQLATHYKSESRVIFGIMNEPHDIPNINTWASSVQAAVNAIRAAGATTQTILIPGSTWSHASALPNEAGPALLKLTDPAGGVSKLVFDVHQYLDSDGSGNNAECSTDNTGVLNTLISWLKSNGRQAMLTETGGGNTASCQTNLKAQLALVKANKQYISGYTVWSAGSFDSSYVLSVTPNGDSDNALWTNAVKPNLA